MSEIRMCVVFCLQMKKKSDFLLFWAATLEKKRERERTREKRSILEKSLQF
jgi:hypothetical protein